MRYPVNEMFLTIQGEGHHTGRPSVFLRLQGCPVGCSWCDTRHTWHLDEERMVERGQTLTSKGDARWAYWPLQSLVRQLTELGGEVRTLVITGGEPCLYDLEPLIAAMEQQGWQCQVETSGCFDINVTQQTWVTVSPKIGMKGGYDVLTSALVRADEIKHPVARTEHIQALDELLRALPAEKRKRIALQPISENSRATRLCLQTCLRRNWHLSLQTHKLADFD